MNKVFRTTWKKSYKHNVEQKKLATNKYGLHDSMYIKFKTSKSKL